MRVALGEVAEGDPPTVVVTASGVSGTGLWRGEAPPTAVTEVDVELEVPGQIDWTDIFVAPDLPGGIAPADGELLLQGVVEGVDQDGILTLRIVHSIVLIETVGEPPVGLVGTHVAVLARHTGIYPTGV